MYNCDLFLGFNVLAVILVCMYVCVYVCVCNPVIFLCVCVCVCAGHHTVYIGVHVPKSYRRRRRHRRRSNHKERRERLMENVSDTETTDDPSSSILKPLSKSQTVHQFTAVCLMIWNTICFAISSPKPSKKIALFAKCKSLFADDLSLCWSSPATSHSFFISPAWNEL